MLHSRYLSQGGALTGFLVLLLPLFFPQLFSLLGQAVPFVVSVCSSSLLFVISSSFHLPLVLCLTSNEVPSNFFLVFWFPLFPSFYLLCSLSFGSKQMVMVFSWMFCECIVFFVWCEEFIYVGWRVFYLFLLLFSSWSIFFSTWTWVQLKFMVVGRIETQHVFKDQIFNLLPQL